MTDTITKISSLAELFYSREYALFWLSCVISGIMSEAVMKENTQVSTDGGAKVWIVRNEAGQS